MGATASRLFGRDDVASSDGLPENDGAISKPQVDLRPDADIRHDPSTPPEPKGDMAYSQPDSIDVSITQQAALHHSDNLEGGEFADNASSHSENMDIDEDFQVSPAAKAAGGGPPSSDREEGEISEDDSISGRAAAPAMASSPPSSRPHAAPLAAQAPPNPFRMPPSQTTAPPHGHPFGVLPVPRPSLIPSTAPAPPRPLPAGPNARRTKGYVDRDGQAAKLGHKYGMGTLPYQAAASEPASLDYGGQAGASATNQTPVHNVSGRALTQVPPPRATIPVSSSSTSLSAQAASFQPRTTSGPVLAGLAPAAPAASTPAAQPSAAASAASAVDRKNLLLERLQAEKHKAAIIHTVQHQVATGSLGDQGLRELVNSVRHLLQLRVSTPEIIALGVPQDFIDRAASTFLGGAEFSSSNSLGQSSRDNQEARAEAVIEPKSSPLSKNKAKRLRRQARLAAEADARLGAQLQTAAALQAMVANAAPAERPGVVSTRSEVDPSHEHAAPVSPHPITAETQGLAGQSSDAVTQDANVSIAALKAKLLTQQKLKKRLQEMQARQLADAAPAAPNNIQTPQEPPGSTPTAESPTHLDASPLPPVIAAAPATLVSAPLRISPPPPAAPPKRGVKRPSAIDLAEQGPSQLSGAAFFSGPKRRKALAPPVPRRMVIDLTSDSEGETDAMDAAATAAAAARQEEDLQRQLADMMRNLEEHKAKIAAKESRRIARLASLAASNATTPRLSPSPAPSHATPALAAAVSLPTAATGSGLFSAANRPSAGSVNTPSGEPVDDRSDSQGEEEMDIDEESSEEKPIDVLGEGNYGREAVVTFDNREAAKAEGAGGAAVNDVEDQSETRYTPLTFLTRTIPYTILELRKATDLSKSITRAKAPKKLNRFPLIYLTLGRISRTSPGIKLCRYEIDGGVCSDVQCDGLHPTRDLVPDNQDLVTLLQIFMPPAQEAKYTAWIAEMADIKPTKTIQERRAAAEKRRRDVETFLSAVDQSLR